MVIGFSNDTAFDFLKERGYVVTFRKNRRKNRNGKDWVNRGRGTEKEFDCIIAEIGKQEMDDRGYPKGERPDMARLQEVSGFGDLDRWKGAISSLNDGIPEEGWLYFVKKLDENE